jgi:excisionase family DNA binding protein
MARSEDFETPAELAERLKIKTRTLQDWRSSGQGPSFIRVGRVIRYRKSDVEDWLNKQAEKVE